MCSIDAYNISARSFVRHIRFWCLQADSKITLTPSRHQIHSKNRNVIRYNLRILTRIFAVWNRLKKQYSHIKRSVLHFVSCCITCTHFTTNTNFWHWNISKHSLSYIRILDIRLELACNGGTLEACTGEHHKKRLMSFVFEKTPRISLTCKLVPVQYREY